MASIEKRISEKNGNITYRVTIRKKGFPPQTATFPDEQTAKLWAQQIEVNLQISKHFSSNSTNTVTFEYAVDKYIKEHIPSLSLSEQEKRTSQLAFWKKEFSGLNLSEITPQLIEKVANELGNTITVRKKAKMSPKTVKRRLAALSHVFTVCLQKWKFIDKNPVLSVENPERKNCRIGYRKDELTPDQVFGWLRQNNIAETMIDQIKQSLS